MAIIVCGGAVLDDGLNPVPYQLVEVYRSDTSQWHQTAPLPHPYAASMFAVIHDYCFLVGEASDGDYGGQQVTYAKTKVVIEFQAGEKTPPSSSSIQKIWKELPTSPLVGSAAAAFSGTLLTIGGDDREGDVINDVHAFGPKTNSWIALHSGDLPEARGGSSAVQLPDKRVVVVGGHGPDGENTATTFIGTTVR